MIASMLGGSLIQNLIEIALVLIATVIAAAVTSKTGH
jgi:hypothetical protein